MLKLWTFCNNVNINICTFEGLQHASNLEIFWFRWQDNLSMEMADCRRTLQLCKHLWLPKRNPWKASSRSVHLGTFKTTANIRPWTSEPLIIWNSEHQKCWNLNVGTRTQIIEIWNFQNSEHLTVQNRWNLNNGNPAAFTWVIILNI